MNVDQEDCTSSPDARSPTSVSAPRVSSKGKERACREPTPTPTSPEHWSDSQHNDNGEDGDTIANNGDNTDGVDNIADDNDNNGAQDIATTDDTAAQMSMCSSPSLMSFR